MMSCISMCVGVGNVWRFAFVALENGGGAFLIPYLIVLIFIGKSMYYLELILGQFPSAGIVGMWAICPAFRGVGYGQAFASWTVTTFYVWLMGLCLYYFIASFNSVLPWAVCGSWASDGCVQVDANASFLLYSNNSTREGPQTISSAEEYLVKQVLKVDQEGFHNGLGLPDWWLSFYLLMSWLVIFVAQVKGIKSSGKSAYFTAIFPYLVLFTMFIRGVTLPGSLKGILFFVTPRWEKLLAPEVWFAAMNQAFYSLSIGYGLVMTFSSYNSFHNNVYADAAILCCFDAFTSVFAGITTFAIVGNLADQMGVEVSKVVVGGGPSLAFISYPDALARFSILPQMFSAMFFLMMFTLGLGTAVACNNVIITIVRDKYPHVPTWRITLGCCVVGFIMGMPFTTPQGQYIFILVDHYSSGVSIIVLVILEIIGIAWVYGLRRLTRDIKFMLNRSTGIFWKLCWGVINPVFLTAVFIYSQVKQPPLTYGNYVFDNASIGVGISLSVVAVGMVPVWFLKELRKKYNSSKGLRHALREVFKASSDWSPKDPIIRQEYYEMLAAKADAPAQQLPH